MTRSFPRTVTAIIIAPAVILLAVVIALMGCGVAS